MSSAPIHISVLALAAFLLSGCGGSSGGNSGNSGPGGGGDSPTTVTFTFTGAAPTTVATSIGSGAFATSTLTSGSLSLQIPAGTTNFAVAFVCPPETFYDGADVISDFVARTPHLRNHPVSGVGSLKAQDITDGIYNSTTEEVFAASTLDGTSFTTTCSNPTENTASNLGSATGEFNPSALGEFVQLDTAGINQGSGASWYVQDITGVGGVSVEGFSSGFPIGIDRVILVVSAVGPNGSLYAVKSLNDQVVPGELNNGEPIVFNISDVVTYQPITYKNLPAGCTTASTQAYFVPSGTQNQIAIGGNNGEYPVAPASAVEQGDSYFIQSDTGPCNTTSFVSMTTSSGGPITISFPTSWSYDGPTAAALPTFPNLNYSGFPGTGTQAVELDTSWSLPSGNFSGYDFIATRNSMGGASSLTFPDLSSVAGFLASPPSGQEVDWVAALVQSTGGIQPVAANGAAISAGSAAGSAAGSSTVSSVVSAGSYIVP